MQDKELEAHNMDIRAYKNRLREVKERVAAHYDNRDTDKIIFMCVDAMMLLDEESYQEIMDNYRS